MTTCLIDAPGVRTRPGRPASQALAFAALRVTALPCEEILNDELGASSLMPPSDVIHLARRHWEAFASSIASCPDPVEALLVLARRRSDDGRRDVVLGLVAIGRGGDPAGAQGDAHACAGTLSSLLASTLPGTELSRIDGAGSERLPLVLGAGSVRELRRRVEAVGLRTGERSSRRSIGFTAASPRAGDAGGIGRPETSVDHQFGWTPADDPWHRLLDALAREPGDAALVGHFATTHARPERARRAAEGRVRALDRAIPSDGLGRGSEAGDGAPLPLPALRHAAERRLATLNGPSVTARLFVATQGLPSAALLATVATSIDASADPPEAGPHPAGGVTWREATTACFVAPFDDADRHEIFSPREATAWLRLPMPPETDLPGLPLRRARRAPMVGRCGNDAPIGTNVHRGGSIAVALDASDRLRHAYVVGQTGTGKSTLLLNLALHDIRAGRGVAVLDPHGSLIDEILLRYPRARAEDLVVIDVLDAERPVGFNPLRIDAPDAASYMLLRDQVIDELLSYLDAAFLSEHRGPMFETHARGMLGLLLGTTPQRSPLVPSFLLLRRLYSDDAFRARMLAAAEPGDPVLGEFIRESCAVRSSDSDMRAMAPYVTSKFSRFIADAGLRAITCQRRCVDIDAIVRDGRVLLVHLGRGRFGDQAAGLLASQVVARLRRAVMARGSGGSHAPFFVHADEFQIFADGRFSELLAEGRKFGLSLTLAHQYAEQLPPGVLQAVLGNVGTVIALRVGPRDGELLSPVFEPTFSRRDLVSQERHRAIVKSPDSLGATAFSVELAPPGEGGDPAAARRLREEARLRHGRLRSDVDAEIRETLAAYAGSG